MRNFTLLTGAALLLICAPPIRAQHTTGGAPNAPSGRSSIKPGAARVPVTVVLVDNLADPSALAMIVRQPGPVPQDLVLMPNAGASGDVLASAIFTLLVVREVGGDTPVAGMTTRVTRVDTPVAWQRSEVPRAERAIERMRSAAPQVVSGFGKGRVLTLYLPAHAFRGKLHQTARPTG